MDLQHLRASDGTGEAVLAHIQSVRNPGSTVLDLDNVDNWNSKAVVVTGTPNANGFISAAGMKVMYGHLNAGDFIIDGYAPGYVDNGNTTSEVAIVKMTTSWADALVSLLSVSLQDNGKLKLTALDDFFKPSEIVFDYVASGAVLAGLGYGANLNASLSAGVMYVNGLRNVIAAVATRTYTASKDTYVDALYNSNGLATIVYTEVANNAASPALAANSIRIGIVVTGASSITSVGSINQGQKDKIVPNVSTVSLAVTDSLGNLICPRDPSRKLLGYREQISTQAINSNAITDLGALSVMPIIVPQGRKVKLTGKINPLSAGGATFGQLLIREGGTTLSITAIWVGNAGNALTAIGEVIIEPSAGLHTYKASIAFGTTTNSAYADANFNAFIKAELL